MQPGNRDQESKQKNKKEGFMNFLSNSFTKTFSRDGGSGSGGGGGGGGGALRRSSKVQKDGTLGGDDLVGLERHFSYLFCYGTSGLYGHEDSSCVHNIRER